MNRLKLIVDTVLAAMPGNWRKFLADRLPKGRVARGIATLASGTAVAQAITIVAMPIVTRLYTPAQIGLITLFISFFSFCAATLSLRYEYALLLARDDHESHEILRLALTLVLLFSFLASPGLWFLQTAELLGFDLLPVWAPLLVVPILIGYGCFIVFRSWGLRAGLVMEITKATLARSAANAVTRICLGILGGGLPALFAAELAGAWAAMLRLQRKVRRHFEPSRPIEIPLKALVNAARRYRKFATVETPSAWINQLTLTLPVPMIASLFGPAAAGWFGLAKAIGSIPATQIGKAAGDVFVMELSAAVRNGDSQRAAAIFSRLLRNLAAFAVLPIAALAALSPLLAPPILGESWSEVGWIITALAPWLYMHLVVNPLTGLLFVLQVQQYKLIYDLVSIVTLLAAYGVAGSFGWSLISTVLAFSVARVVSYLAHLIVIILIVRSRLRGPASL